MAKVTQKDGSRKKSSQQSAKRSLVSKSKANAEAGFAKRQDLKDKKQRETIQDVYEYLPEKTRRSKVKMDLDKSEAMEFGDIDGFDQEQRDTLRARLIGENDDDEKVDSDDDEEVDSDAAFEEEDEERFAEFFSKKNKKSVSHKGRTVRFTEVDLTEDREDHVEDKQVEANSEEEFSEEEGDEFIDLLDVLDGKGDIDMGCDNDTAKKKDAAPQRSGGDNDGFVSEGNDSDQNDVSGEIETSDNGEEDEDEDEDEETNYLNITASDDEDLGEGEEALDELQNFVSNLDTATKKRKAPEETTDAARVRKRRTIREKTETGAEDEFRIDSSGSKLNLDDLLAPLATPSASLQSLKKSTKILGSSKTKALSAPLPQRAQERLDREAAYEQTKEEVDKWSGTMKKIREAGSIYSAEHLSFPLQAQKPGRVSNMELTAKFKPTTGMESAVDALLKNAKMRDEDIHETEEGMLQANNLTLEEVAARRAELRKMRELMFRAEIKAKRMNKIKSRTYRKIRRKEKERLAEKIDEEEDSDDDDVRAKRDLDRARERASLRHKHTGKWARQMKNKHLGDDQRKELEEMLSKGEKLRKRIQGLGSDESEEEDSSDDEDLGPEEALDKIKISAYDELQQLKAGNDEELVSSQKKGNGIMQMKFMKDTIARQEAAANRDLDDFVQELGAGEREASDQETEDEVEIDPSSGILVHRAGGRVVYRPGVAPNKPALQIPSVIPPPSDTSSVTLRSTDLYSPPPASPLHVREAAPGVGVNPWLLQSDASASLKVSKKNSVTMSRESKFAEKSKNKLKKETHKREEERARAKDDASLEISTDNVLTLGEDGSSRTLKKTAKSAGRIPVDVAAVASDSNDEDSDANSELDAQEQTLLSKSKGNGKAGPSAFQQRNLVALAFAGDNVIKEFAEAKQREIAEDAPKEVDTTIPGWGSWGGTGLRRKPPKPQRVKKIAGIDPTTRADYNKKHIIISEKMDKKASKYLVKDLPYPYSSQAQFEKAMERPLGVQWNTRTAFQRATLPRVVKKPGVVITPLEKMV